MNKPLTAEEAKKLTFPCLLEVWDYGRMENAPIYLIVENFENSKFQASHGSTWIQAALPCPKITEAMKRQFGGQNEYPKRMLVWDSNEAQALERIVLADLGEKTKGRYITVQGCNESEFENGEMFSWSYFKNAKPIPEPDPISQEIAELRQRLADLEAKHNQQS